MTLLKAYWRTLRQYAASPKTQYEYKHYAIFFILYCCAVLVIWGGIYFFHGNY